LLEAENSELKLKPKSPAQDAVSIIAYDNLKKTNERMMQEIIRLNNKIREANNTSSFNESIISNSVYYQ